MDGESKSELLQISQPAKRLELDEVQAKLSSARGPEYWRSLEELSGKPEFDEMMHREFPRHAAEWTDPVSRRGFLKLMGASMALAGLSACTKPPLQPIVPYVKQPEGLVPGRAMFFATAMTLGGYGLPLLVTSHEGRPTKVEGNPDHAVSQGASDLFAQASVLTLYDPDRSQTALFQGDIRPWPAFVAAMQAPLAAQKTKSGAGLRVLTQTVSSPTLAAQIKELLQKFPQAKWHQWEAANQDGARGGAMMAFGQYVETRYRLNEADVIVSLDADFLYAGFPGFTEYARQWASRRNPDATRGLNRLYVIESTPSPTGFKADHRLAARPSELESLARALASGVGVNAGASGTEHAGWIAAVAKDLQKHRGACVVMAGEKQPPVVHALAHGMNQALGNVGKTVFYTDPVEANPANQTVSLRELRDDIEKAKVDLLLILGGNPVYDTPVDIDFGNGLQRVPMRVHVGLYQNETAANCDWHVNQTHYLEEWSDVRAANGAASIVQPLIAPLYGGKSAHEVLAVFNGQADPNGYDIVRGYWKSQYKGTDFEMYWRKSVHDGFVAGSEFQPKQVAMKAADFKASAATKPDEGLEVIFRRDPSVHDGRFSNNAWLQECPKPLNKMTWDNPVLVSPATAKKLLLSTNDVVELTHRGKKQNGAIWIQPGHPDDAVTLYLGYGRMRSGRSGTGAGFNAYLLQGADDVCYGSGLELRKTGEVYNLATTQGWQTMEGRGQIRAASVDDYKKNPAFAHEERHAPEREETMYPEHEYKDYAWGMTINTSSCVGCNACVVACVSENNIPVVGRAQVIRGRHMHWLRVDSYYQGDPASPRGYYQPVPCMQCEDAPCEVVCPVGATVHSSEGLNDMVYNRCVGTRYCSNNCPYKVRRFNFLLWQDWTTPQYKMMRNPEVTVRSRGVMEKCTYCVQRITHKRIEAEERDGRVQDGELQTACQQACPTQAIVFGDINDSRSQVAKSKSSPLNYGLLEDLNTRPRTTYLAAVLNPNPEISDAQPERS